MRRVLSARKADRPALLRLIAGSISAILAATVLVAIAPAESAKALTGSDFNPGYIISDHAFYNGSAMTQAEIQTFLNSKCVANNCMNVVLSPSTSRAATNMCPGGYVGATSETSAAILFKVQQSCGISAKVLLVTLQKEQGLVTLANPSAAKLQKAMGYACPDTAVCDSQFYGFFNQVYSAASQLKRYGLRTADNVSFRTKFQIGVPYPILYNPNANCGTQTVTVRNMATTALYYYTPYTPNAAALANLGGVGDGCSAYGNRNFWVYYNSWFGSSLAGAGEESITAAVAAAGGTAVLGAAQAPLVCPELATTCEQAFANGSIYWTIRSGAQLVSGAILATYLAAGGSAGSLGYPWTGVFTYTENGGGIAQDFQNNASIYSSARGAYIVDGALRTAYFSTGGSAGPLGWPVGAKNCSSGSTGCWQNFASGAAYAGATGSGVVLGNIATAWQLAGGGSGVLGYPTTGVFTYPENGGGTAQDFQNSSSIFSSAAGAFPVRGAIRAAYFRLGGSVGTLGWPTALETCGLAAGGCSQVFQFGTVYASQTAGGAVTGAIASAYATAGGPNGLLGYPTTGVFSYAENGGGTAQDFQNGASIFASSAGAFPVRGAVRSGWFKLGGSVGSLGWPVSAEVCPTSTTCSQAFQYATMNSTGVPSNWVASGAILTAWQAAGGSGGPLGPAVSGVYTYTFNGGGTAQDFQNSASIFQSTSGAFPVLGIVRPAYFKLGGSGGWLGWPTASQVCGLAGGGCSQAFQNGSMFVKNSAVGGGVTPAIRTAYLAAGGPGGSLGYPTTIIYSYTANGGGQAQDFENGSSIFSSASGTFAVQGAVRSAYFRQGGSDGSLGWPTSNATCSGVTGSCTQSFQHGSITAG